MPERNSLLRFRVHQNPLDYHVIEECLAKSMTDETVPKPFKEDTFCVKLNMGKRSVYLDPMNALLLASFLTYQASLLLAKNPDVERKML